MQYLTHFDVGGDNVNIMKDWNLPSVDTLPSVTTRNKRIILPIYHSTEEEGREGSWSLLVWDIQASKGFGVKAQYRHFDSTLKMKQSHFYKPSAQNFSEATYHECHTEYKNSLNIKSAQLVADKLHKVTRFLLDISMF